jgi:hypothetical protein
MVQILLVEDVLGIVVATPGCCCYTHLPGKPVFSRGASVSWEDAPRHRHRSSQTFLTAASENRRLLLSVFVRLIDHSNAALPWHLWHLFFGNSAFERRSRA